MLLGPLQARVSGGTWGCSPQTWRSTKELGLLRPWKGPRVVWGEDRCQAYLVEELRLQSCPLSKQVLARTLGRRPGRVGGRRPMVPTGVDGGAQCLPSRRARQRGKWLRRPSRVAGSL